MVRRTATATTMDNNAAAATTTPTKKKKGRPSVVDVQNRALQQQTPKNSINNNSQSHFPTNRRSRSTRRIPNIPAHFLDGSDSDDHILSGPTAVNSDISDDHDDYNDDDDDDGDQRAPKKVKIVVQFPDKKLVNAVGSQKNIEKGWIATDNNLNGTTRMLGALEHGLTTSTRTAAKTTSTPTRLPDKKLLLLLLDKLQKKDTRGVFAEPVDPEELPDYHEIIENPMDFMTVRKKLLGGVYTILEHLEDDVNLICSNAMQYNAPSTVFYRQARAIQELAKKEFDILRRDGCLGETPPKPRRGRPPGSRNLKKLLESSLPERTVTVREPSPVATPASREEDPSSYNLRKGPSLYRFPRSFDYCFDYSGFSPSSSKSMSVKYGKKTFGSDESRRNTYFLSDEPNPPQDPHSLSTFEGLEKELTPVGLALDHSYSRSLARFASDLGPAVRKVVSKKLASVLPAGAEFGPELVGEPKMSFTQTNDVSQDTIKSEPHHPKASGFPNRSTDLSSKPSTSSGTQFQEAIVRPTSSPLSSSSTSWFNNPYAIDSSSTFDAGSECDLVALGQGMPYWQNLSIQERWDHPYHVEIMNRGFQASSS